MTSIAEGGAVCCRCSDNFLSFEVFVGDSFFATGSFFCAVVIERATCEGLVGNACTVCGSVWRHRPAHNSLLLHTGLLYRPHVLIAALPLRDARWLNLDLFTTRPVPGTPNPAPATTVA